MSNIDKELEKAVYEDDLKEVKALLSAGANPNLIAEKNEFQGRLLHAARNVEIVRELISHGANINATNQYGETPLHRAAIGNLTLVREFLKSGAGVNLQNRKGNTPLNFAVKTRNRNLKIITELLENGADINIRNHGTRGQDNHRTPLDNAGSVAPLLIKITLLKNFDKNYRKIIDLDSYKEHYDYNKLSSYLEDCVREVSKMKTDSIDNSLSLYELITSKPANKEALYVNEEGVKKIRSSVFQVLTSTNYPIYHNYISSKICSSLSLERASLLIKLSELEVFTKSDASNHTQDVKEKFVVLDSYSQLKIAQYLSNNDLLNFITAFYRHTDQPSCLKKNFIESSTQPNKRLYEAEASTSNYAKRTRLE